MASPRRFFIVDAFSDRPFSGNPAVIVPDAEGLSDRDMQALAAELRMEAGFILSPSTSDADLRLRFFSPHAEVDVSGHVTVAAYTALQAAGRLPGVVTPAGHRVRQQSRAGVLAVDLTSAEGGGGPWVTLDFGRPAFGPQVDREEVQAALRVDAEALILRTGPRVVTCGVPLVVVAMADSTALHAAAPDMQKLAALSRRRGVLGVVAFARPGLHPESSMTARFFFPVVGPDEDPVSGAALAAAVAYAVRERQLPCVGETTFSTDQGHTLGRPNRAQVIVRTEAGQVANIKVRGRGAVVASGEFRPIEPRSVLD
jgi:PhzF family phenazine biosynthesis protein